MSTFKFNTGDDTAGTVQNKFPFPEQLNEEDRFLAEVLTEIAPAVRALQATSSLSEEKRTKILSEIKKVLEAEK